MYMGVGKKPNQILQDIVMQEQTVFHIVIITLILTVCIRRITESDCNNYKWYEFWEVICKVCKAVFIRYSIEIIT